jgi:hypothetical protein
MDNGKRWVAGQALHLAGCMMLHPLGELGRVLSIHGLGLTPKEQKFLSQRVGIIEDCLRDISKLSTRVRHTTGEFKRHGA